MDNKDKVLVVDDSSFMRLMLGNILHESPELEVAGMATNGLEAVKMCQELDPDVVLMDITMEEYDGLYAIRRIMKEMPTPIVVLSALGNTHPEIVFEALEAGACDFIHKPINVLRAEIRRIASDLTQKISAAARLKRENLLGQDIRRNTNHHTFPEKAHFEILAIGASTGGPRAIETLVQMLPSNLSFPVVIAQHMPKDFLHAFAERLDRLVDLKVKLAEEGETVAAGTIYLSNGLANLRTVRKLERVAFSYTIETYKEFNFPSVDCLLESVGVCYGKKAIGLVMTGMGKDGAKGLAEIQLRGGLTLAQDEASSVVFGMPKAAIELSKETIVLPLKDIAGYVVNSL